MQDIFFLFFKRFSQRHKKTPKGHNDEKAGISSRAFCVLRAPVMNEKVRN